MFRWHAVRQNARRRSGQRAPYQVGGTGGQPGKGHLWGLRISRRRPAAIPFSTGLPCVCLFPRRPPSPPPRRAALPGKSVFILTYRIPGDCPDFSLWAAIRFSPRAARWWLCGILPEGINRKCRAVAADAAGAPAGAGALAAATLGLLLLWLGRAL